MLKVVRKLIDGLSDLAKGMKANSGIWANQVVTEPQVQAAIADLQAKSDAVEAAERALDRARLELNATVEKHQLIETQVEKLAEGIHAAEPHKLVDYNMDLPSARKAKAAPAKTVVDKIEDDDDGVGFVVVFQPLADAEGFEIERSEGQPADTLVLAPPYKFLRTIQKLKFTDDDVEKGKRYFYRARAYNRRGYGAWSEPVSRVQ